jgi:hypothetical protein
LYSVNQQQQQQQQQQNYNICFGPTSRVSRNFFSWVSFNIIAVGGHATARCAQFQPLLGLDSALELRSRT